MWQVLDTGRKSAAENMRLDAEMLQTLRDRPILHFYEWERESITYGYFVRPYEHLRQEGVEKRGMDIARRPTGGGIVFHSWDLAFSVLVPSSHPRYSQKPLDNYIFINRAVLLAVRQFLQHRDALALISEDAVAWSDPCRRFCMARPTQYDVVWEGRKVAGAAQRRGRGGFLHQGTIALLMPPEAALKELLREGSVRDAIRAHTFPLLGAEGNLEEARTQLKEQLEAQLTIL